MNASRTIVWLRNDLRVADHGALRAAADRGGAVIPVFVWAPGEEGVWAPGAASRWWLHHALAALDDDLKKRGSRLILRRGASAESLLDVARAVNADAVYWQRAYEPHRAARDARVEETLARAGLATETFSGALLHEPTSIRTGQGSHYKVFSPFWRACGREPDPIEPLPAPRTLPGVRPWPESVDLEALDLLPRIDWAGGLRATWTPGLDGARRALRRFTREALEHYPTDRDRPDREGVSRLSPHLHFGEVSPRMVWHAVQRAASDGRPAVAEAAAAYVRQLGWREFSAHLLVHEPHTPTKPLRPEFERFPWRRDPPALRAWQRGQTGYPIVDAGMRQLWKTGWMHNRVRMIVASFLVKDLLIPWQAGAEWFWDTLVDADLANNTMGWQWTAGSGADAAPYFRVFNPILQGKRFDPEGLYVRRFCPELEKLPDRYVHAPWEAPADVLAAAKVELGSTYPEPMVDHAAARDAALEAYDAIRQGS